MPTFFFGIDIIIFNVFPAGETFHIFHRVFHSKKAFDKPFFLSF